jgi:5-carboxymethyl-2-hydroxymuconate isomerase
MPHIHLETTSDLPENANIPDILDLLVQVLSRQETVGSASVKAYHSLRSNWSVGEGHPNGIAHCTVSILSGRTREQKAAISSAMASALRSAFEESLSACEVGLTLELREMDKDYCVKAAAP